MILMTSFVQLSVISDDCIPYGTTQASKIVHAKAFVVVLAVRTALVSFEYLSVLIMTYWLSFIVVGIGLKISMETKILPVLLWRRVVECVCVRVCCQL